MSTTNPAGASAPADAWKAEVGAGSRFAFGANWQAFAAGLGSERIAAAERSLVLALRQDRLDGLRFLDIGSGSGLFSLAARRMGAAVVSFDFDPDSVACTAALRAQHLPDESQWVVRRGSVLDGRFIASLGTFDIVYSWGVLHHTGDMATAVRQAAAAVRPSGRLFIAIYDDQGAMSRYWLAVKRIYNWGFLGRMAMILVHFPSLYLARGLKRWALRRGPLPRGMSLWTDMIDWLGGYPFEVATPDAIFRCFADQGWTLLHLKTCGGRGGCNEFVFRAP